MTTTNDVLIGFVLDQSGSMNHLKESTISGFNEFIESQRVLPGEARLTLTLFDSESHTRFVGTALSDVPELGSHNNAYRPSGLTALCDALGDTVKNVEQWQSENPDFTGSVKIVTYTDGAENSSRRWFINTYNPNNHDYFNLLNLIEYKQKEGWEFIFLGIGGSNWLENNLNSVVDHTQFFAGKDDPNSNASSYAGLTRSFTNSRASGQSIASTYVPNS